jgi:hypothetical protein
MSLALGPFSGSDNAEVLFYAANQTSGVIGARWASDGTVGTLGSLPGTGAAPTYSGLGLLALPTETSAVASFNSVSGTDDGKLVVLGASTGGHPFGAPSMGILDAPQPGPGLLESPANILVSGTQALFLKQGNSAGLWVQPVTGLDNTTPTFPAGVRVGTASAVYSAGQALLSDGSASLGVFNANQDIYRYTGTIQQGSNSALDYGPPALLDDSRGYIGAQTTLIAFNPSTSAAGTTVGTFTSGFLKTTPVLGAPRPSSPAKLGYAVSTTGHLIVFDSVSGALEWKTSSPLPGSAKAVAAHPTLDCSRTGSRTTGTLYVLYTDGNVQAVIVDSPGLDSSAVWPKYQRTSGNAGNPDSRFPIRSPLCP